MTKKVPIRTSCCPSSEESPARSCATRSSVVSSSWSRPRRSRRCSHVAKAAEQREPAEHQERNRREAERGDLGAVDRRRRARLDEPPDAAAQDREHDQPEADRRQRHSHPVELRTPLGVRGLRDPPAEKQDPDHDHGLGGEHVAPRELRRHPAADQRTGRDGDRGDAPEQRVGDRAVAALVAGGGERRDRGDHEHCAEPLDARPADQQDAEVGAQGRGERPDPVDRQADREGAVAAEDVAELRAEQHERRHHERVEGDRGLHALDRRVEVVDDLRDRDVHDARVEHHHELRRGQDHHGQPLAHRDRVSQSHWAMSGRPIHPTARRPAAGPAHSLRSWRNRRGRKPRRASIASRRLRPRPKIRSWRERCRCRRRLPAIGRRRRAGICSPASPSPRWRCRRAWPTPKLPGCRRCRASTPCCFPPLPTPCSEPRSR